MAPADPGAPTRMLPQIQRYGIECGERVDFHFLVSCAR
jgi:hypothetical protein